MRSVWNSAGALDPASWMYIFLRCTRVTRSRRAQIAHTWTAVEVEGAAKAGAPVSLCRRCVDVWCRVLWPDLMRHRWVLECALKMHKRAHAQKHKSATYTQSTCNGFVETSIDYMCNVIESVPNNVLSKSIWMFCSSMSGRETLSRTEGAAESQSTKMCVVPSMRIHVYQCCLDVAHSVSLFAIA